MLLRLFLPIIFILLFFHFPVFGQENESSKESMENFQHGGLAYMQENYKEAADFYLKFVLAQKTNAPDPKAMNLFSQGGMAYMKGNYKQAADLYLKSGMMIGQGTSLKPDTPPPSTTDPTQSGIDAWNKIGEEYYFGDNGKSPNYPEALKWLTKASDGGHANASQIVATMYYTGTGVAKNVDKGIHYYHRAAELGHAKAQGMLGISYFKGDGVHVSKQKSFKWNKLAADQGLAISQRYLGILYTDPSVVKPDDGYPNVKNAFIYALLAATAGDEKGKEILRIIIQGVGQKAAQAWQSDAQKKLEEINEGIRRKNALKKQAN